MVVLAVVAKKFVVVALVVVELPKVTKPRFALVENKLVDEAVVEKIEVVVALVEVELRAVKFCKVVEPLESKVEKVPRPVEVTLPALMAVAKRLVLEAVVEKRLVVVAFVPVALPKRKSAMFALVEKRLVEEAVPEKREVVVAEVVVEFVRIIFVKVASSVVLLKTKPESPPNDPPSLNCTWVSEPPGIPEPVASVPQYNPPLDALTSQFRASREETPK